jgi:hypothetical protein
MSFRDNGDGTITDNSTGLMWEKKSGPGSGFHNVTLTFSWSQPGQSGTAPDGTAFTQFLADLNGQWGPNIPFANHSDWRLPTANELLSIVDRSRPNPGPFIDPIFGDTQSFYYWSNTDANNLGPNDPYYALCVNFGYVTNIYPAIQNGHKVEPYRCYYRAVRGP